MEAISVPRPPKLAPTIRLSHRSVKPDSSSAAGTLLITWLAATAVSASRPRRIPSRNSLKTGRRPILPIKTKKPTKVSSRE